MANEPLKGMRVAILVADKFEQVEMTEPRKALEKAGAETKLISTQRGQVYGMHHDDEKGDAFPVDLTFGEANPSEFDALHLPGGVINADRLRIIPQAQAFVQRIQNEGKPIGVICHGPWLLVSAGLVRGRKLTSFPTLQDDIRNAGGNWVDREVCRDGNWVSSRKPDDIPAFNRELVALFSEHKPAAARSRNT
jgi:protease I